MKTLYIGSKAALLIKQDQINMHAPYVRTSAGPKRKATGLKGWLIIHYQIKTS